MRFGADAWAVAALPMFAVLPPRCSMVAPPRVDTSAVQPKQEPPVSRVASAPPRAPQAGRPEGRAIALPEEVVVRALSAGQTAFLHCWARAQQREGAIASKVQLHLEVDAEGKVIAASSDADSPALSRCLTLVARHLPFPAPGQLAMVDLPLIFR